MYQEMNELDQLHTYLPSLVLKVPRHQRNRKELFKPQWVLKILAYKKISGMRDYWENIINQSIYICVCVCVCVYNVGPLLGYINIIPYAISLTLVLEYQCFCFLFAFCLFLFVFTVLGFVILFGFMFHTVILRTGSVVNQWRCHETSACGQNDLQS